MFLPNVPGATFIQGATFIPDSRVVYILLIRPSPKTSRDMDEQLQIAHDINIMESLKKNSYLFKDHTFANLNFMKISVKRLRTRK